MKKDLIRCGCGVEVMNISGPTHEYIGSNAGCWQIFCEVLAREYTQYNELWKTHRFTVDAYAVQHPGDNSRRAVQSVYVHLARLYLQLERGINGKQVNYFMKKMINYKTEYKWLSPPDFSGTLNINDVAKAKNLEEHKTLVYKWAESVWSAWEPHHIDIAAFAEKVISAENKIIPVRKAYV